VARYLLRLIEEKELKGEKMKIEYKLLQISGTLSGFHIQASISENTPSGVRVLDGSIKVYTAPTLSEVLFIAAKHLADQEIKSVSVEEITIGNQGVLIDFPPKERD
jgi:hypothetical protein